MEDYSPLDEAILSQSRSQITTLLKNGHNLDRYNDHNHFGYLAENSKNNDFLIWLFELGLDIDSLYFDEPSNPVDYGFSFLNYAIYGNNTVLVQYLLQHGVELWSEYYHTSPLYVAIDNDRMEIVKLLLDYGILDHCHYVDDILKCFKKPAYRKVVKNYVRPTMIKRAK